ncbi:MAG: hypothetical protein HWN66_16655 [Candidatus Helarchaeota archaeon]|nr:hypothetical protein [Candidatus Helarchaeota archaeon]
MIVPSASKIAAKWARVTPERSVDYEDGVRNPLRDWAEETADSESRYEAGIKSAMARKAFGKGVKRVGTAKQKSKTILKGIPRWPEGVRVAEADMRTGMEKVVSTLEGITLPPRFETGDPRNIERVKVIQQALHKMKTG